MNNIIEDEIVAIKGIVGGRKHKVEWKKCYYSLLLVFKHLYIHSIVLLVLPAILYIIDSNRYDKEVCMVNKTKQYYSNRF